MREFKKLDSRGKEHIIYQAENAEDMAVLRDRVTRGEVSVDGGFGESINVTRGLKKTEKG